ncbi:GSCOCT00013379001.2-RA-CDS [Cotesia congregata]|uniref:Cc_bv8.14_14.8 n=1 Tax=Cotesia congregata TaxID=51543 RepID=S6D4W7_COTCN|nr:GSCOCT00013379001.2-RA-CDS [Cotesia congregata]CAG5075271.1 cc_bv8.14_14.8 [Cotesia congregata]CCQ71342.1 hypothetical protein BV8-14 [Cotesia congregata]
MEVKYVAIHHRELDTYILVPKQWPKRANSLFLTLADQIIAQFNEVSPVVRMCDIPTRLICRVDDSGFYYIFNKVSIEEMIGIFVYNIVVPDGNEDIEVEIFSGQYLNRISWPDDGTLRAIPQSPSVSCYMLQS